MFHWILIAFLGNLLMWSDLQFSVGTVCITLAIKASQTGQHAIAIIWLFQLLKAEGIVEKTHGLHLSKKRKDECFFFLVFLKSINICSILSDLQQDFPPPHSPRGPKPFPMIQPRFQLFFFLQKLKVGWLIPGESLLINECLPLRSFSGRLTLKTYNQP